MRNKLLAAAFSCLLLTGAVMASSALNFSLNQWMAKGYVTLGRNIVILSERLQTGDRIELVSADGKMVLNQHVGNGYLASNLSRVPAGVYNLTVYRNGAPLTSQMVPFAGRGER